MELTVSEYIKIRHDSDSRRVKFVHIDYSTVQTVTDLLQWAYLTFELPLKSKSFMKKANQKKLLHSLWDTLAERKQHYIVLEDYPRHKSDDLKRVLEGPEGWKQILGFHLSRDYFVEIAFLQNPETKGKKPRTKAFT